LVKTTGNENESKTYRLLLHQHISDDVLAVCVAGQALGAGTVSGGLAAAALPGLVGRCAVLEPAAGRAGHRHALCAAAPAPGLPAVRTAAAYLHDLHRPGCRRLVCAASVRMRVGV